jgi:ureidoglycolate lyase
MIVLEALTPAGFAPFGMVIDTPLEPGRTPPLAVVDNHRAGAALTMAVIRLPGLRSLTVETLERHVQSGQCFVAMGGGALLVVVTPTAQDGGPDTAALRAFVAAPGQSFAYRPGVWHAPMAAIGEDATVGSLLYRDGSAADAEIHALPAVVSLDLRQP